MGRSEVAGAADRRRELRRSTNAAIRPLWNRIYIPNMLLAIGQGAMLPVLVYAAREVHGSTAAASALVAINGFGTMLFDLPAGRIVSRLGEWRAGWVATGLLVVGLLGCLWARSIVVLAVGVFVQAAGLAVWTLVRMTYLSRAAPVVGRGRALSLFGGVMRAGNVIGPFAFVAVASRTDVRPAFVLYLAGVVIGFVWMLCARDRTDTVARQPSEERPPAAHLRENRRQFSAAGSVALGISLLRGSRTAIVPLWAVHIGLGPTGAAELVAFSSVIDLALFYPAGVASDRFGRRAVALPCILLLALGHLTIPFTDSFTTLFAASFVLALGNGLGAGIVMTMGADLAPDHGRASFLAVWRMISDGGSAVGPLVDSAVVAVATLSVAGPVVAILGFATAAVMATFYEEPAHLRRPRSRQRAPAALAEEALGPDG